MSTTPITQSNLQTAVNLWFSDNLSAISTYGLISNWDVSGCTDMSDLFSNRYQPNIINNIDISKWNVGKVTKMHLMFYQSYALSIGDISEWNVSNVTTMRWMFYLSRNTPPDLSRWNTVKVTDMDSMFSGCAHYGDISKWNVKNVVNMNEMFYYADFSGDISKWNVFLIKSAPVNFGVIPAKQPQWGATWPLLNNSLQTLVFKLNDAIYDLSFSAGTFYYTVNTKAATQYTVTIQPTLYNYYSTIVVNGQTVANTSSITIKTGTTVTINLANAPVPSTVYTITLPSPVTCFSAINSGVLASTQRLKIYLDNTVTTAPIVQWVQDISQAATGNTFTTNGVNQRFVFGSWIYTPLELNSTVDIGTGLISSNVKANKFVAYSDVRLKQNIKELSEIQGVDNIRVVQYNNKSDHSKHFGVIAQELAEIYPELVRGTDMQSVSYTELIPICINEIQMLKKDIILLEERFASLESLIDERKTTGYI
jgi:surface protein